MTCFSLYAQNTDLAKTFETFSEASAVDISEWLTEESDGARPPDETGFEDAPMEAPMEAPPKMATRRNQAKPVPPKATPVPTKAAGKAKTVDKAKAPSSKRAAVAEEDTVVGITTARKLCHDLLAAGGAAPKLVTDVDDKRSVHEATVRTA